ncbi:MAG: hypothetical protein ACLPSW_24445 [Roseiarcus sp.]
MTDIEILTAIGGTRSLATLDGFSRSVWTDHAAGKIDDAGAQALAEAIHARRREVRGIDTVAQRAPHVAALAKGQGRLSHFPPKRKPQRSPDRRASIERRRTLAASGPMPPQLSCQFTTGELAVLRLVADEVRTKLHCTLTLGELAARAGVGITTARNALHEAAGHGYLTIEERRRDKRPNLSNVVRIVSREWLVWIERGRKSLSAGRGNADASASQRGGSKKMESTDKGSKRTYCGDRVKRGQHSKNLSQKPKEAAFGRG